MLKIIVHHIRDNTLTSHSTKSKAVNVSNNFFVKCKLISQNKTLDKFPSKCLHRKQWFFAAKAIHSSLNSICACLCDSFAIKSFNPKKYFAALGEKHSLIICHQAFMGNAIFPNSSHLPAHLPPFVN